MSAAPAISDMSSGREFEYGSESELMTEFHQYMSDPNNVETAADYLFYSLLDDTILGVVFEVHHSLKAGVSDAVEGQPEDNKSFNITDFDVFGVNISKKTVDCPNCDRVVGAPKFAPHLEKCMGMGRNSSRIASRRIANSREVSLRYFGGNFSDDEDDADWSGQKRRKKFQTVRSNGNKRNGKSF